MLPSPRLFRSRWTAAIWAGGIIWMAVDVAESAPGGTPTTNASAPMDAAGSAIDAADLATIANAIGE